MGGKQGLVRLFHHWLRVHWLYHSSKLMTISGHILHCIHYIRLCTRKARKLFIIRTPRKHMQAHTQKDSLSDTNLYSLFIMVTLTVGSSVSLFNTHNHASYQCQTLIKMQMLTQYRQIQTSSVTLSTQLYSIFHRSFFWKKSHNTRNVMTLL